MYIVLFNNAKIKGRKSRRERRIAKEKRLREKASLSPLSFIISESKEKKDESNSNRSRSRSSSSSSNSTKNNRRSKSPSAAKLCFITSFGEEAEENSNEEINSFMKEIDKSIDYKINTTKASLKRLKENVCRSRSLTRSRSRSPIVNEKKALNDIK